MTSTTHQTTTTRTMTSGVPSKLTTRPHQMFILCSSADMIRCDLGSLCICYSSISSGVSTTIQRMIEEAAKAQIGNCRKLCSPKTTFGSMDLPSLCLCPYNNQIDLSAVRCGAYEVPTWQAGRYSSTCRKTLSTRDQIILPPNAFTRSVRISEFLSRSPRSPPCARALVACSSPLAPPQLHLHLCNLPGWSD